MKPFFTLLLAAAAGSTGFVAGDARADPALSFSGSAGVVSDYRLRGVSQSDRDPAVQASFLLTHDSGFYAGAWGSSMDGAWFEDSSTELDPLVGWSGAIGEAYSLDVGATVYTWPGSRDTAYVEPYAGLGWACDALAMKVSIAWVPSGQDNFDPESEDGNVYASLGGTYDLHVEGLKAVAQVGYEDGPYYDRKLDWKLGFSYTLAGRVEFSAFYIDADMDDTAFTALPIDRWADRTVVGSVMLLF